MSIPIRVADILSEVQFQLHLPAFNSGEFVTQDDAVRLLQSSARRLSGLLTRLYGDAFFAETATLTTVPNFDLVSLPDNFATLRSVHWMRDGLSDVLLERSYIKDYDDTPRAWINWSCPKYRLESNVLVLQPIPSDTYTLRVNYTTGIFIPDSIFGDGGTSFEFEGQIFWQEWMVADLCYAITKREQKDPTNFLNDLMRYESQMREHVSNRDRYNTYQVVDVRNELEPQQDTYYMNRRRWGW